MANLFLLEIDHVFPANEAAILLVPTFGHVITQRIQKQFRRSVGVNHQWLCTEHGIVNQRFLSYTK